jgi:hypothetical protein
MRKKTELELKINSNRLSEAQKLAKIGSWELNLVDDVFFSEQFYTIFEIDKNIPIISPLKSRLINSDDINYLKTT